MPNITVCATHAATQFMLMAVRPEVRVNGEVTTLRWRSTTSLEVRAGTHAVEVYFPYLGRKSGPAETTVTVKDGETLHLSYRAPILVTSRGTLTHG